MNEPVAPEATEIYRSAFPAFSAVNKKVPALFIVIPINWLNFTDNPVPSTVAAPFPPAKVPTIIFGIYLIAIVGLAVGVNVGLVVGFAVVGVTVGLEVGITVGEAVVGVTVGFDVDVNVGLDVGITVGKAVVGFIVGTVVVGTTVGKAVVGLVVGTIVGIAVVGLIVGIAVEIVVGI